MKQVRLNYQVFSWHHRSRDGNVDPWLIGWSTILVQTELF